MSQAASPGSESAIAFACAGERLLGIVTRPQQAATTGVVIVVGGPQYRVGSHRQFVLLARDLAEAGYAVLRLSGASGVTELALVIVCAVLLLQNRSLRTSLPPPAPPVPRLWQSFLMPGKPTAIVVPSPLYFFWPSQNLYY